MAQLVEQLPPTPEIRGSIPVIVKIYMYYQLKNYDVIKTKVEMFFGLFPNFDLLLFLSIFLLEKYSQSLGIIK